MKKLTENVLCPPSKYDCNWDNIEKLKRHFEDPLCKLSLIAGAADAKESVMSSYIFNKNIIP